MIEEVALVARCDGEYAEIEASSRAGCAGCEAGSSCSTASLARFLGRRRNGLRARNPIGARPGEKVVVGLREAALTRASLAFYLVPLVGLIGTALLAEWLAARFLSQTPELVITLSGLLGLAGGLLLARLWFRRQAGNIRYQAVILRRAQGSAPQAGLLRT